MAVVEVEGEREPVARRIGDHVGGRAVHDVGAARHYTSYIIMSGGTQHVGRSGAGTDALGHAGEVAILRLSCAKALILRVVCVVGFVDVASSCAGTCPVLSIEG